MAKEVEQELNSDGNVYGGPDAAANYMGLDDSYKKADGSWDFQRASRDANARRLAREAALPEAGDPFEDTGGNLVFGGVGTDTKPYVVNPDGGGGEYTDLPDIITDPTGGGGGPGGDDGRFQPGQQPPSDTSWNWDAFAPKRQGDGGWGGYDEDYQAFERYQPGMDSPWGMPDIEGGNKEFYQQQFANLLRDDQGYRNRARDAQERAAWAADPANQNKDTSFDWANVNGGQGLKDVRVSGGDLPEGVDPNSWVRNDNFNLTQGMTNQQAVNSMNDIWSPDESAMWSQYFGKDGGNANGQYWMSDKAGQDPNAILSGFPDSSPEFGGAVQKFVNNAWGQAGDAYSGGVAPGYAMPI